MHSKNEIKHGSTQPEIPVRASLLAIGGVDPSGGAGVLIDSAAAKRAGLHCAAVCAVNTVQDGLSFLNSDVQNINSVKQSIDLIFASQNVTAVKTGALGTAPMIEAVSGALTGQSDDFFLVVDPVLGSTSGGTLTEYSSLDTFKTRLLPLATLVTPNLFEASKLCGFNVNNIQTMEKAGHALVETGVANVLVKGGHLEGPRAVDVLVFSDHTVKHFAERKIPAGEVRGTGCALASLTASYLGTGQTLENAVILARKVLLDAIKNAYFAGKGPGILDFDNIL